MLPLQLQQSVGSVTTHSTSTVALRASTSSMIRPGLAYAQARSFWWRRGCDYSSKIDPMFHRFTRFRTLKTRAKLIEKIRRRGKWDLDGAQHPFLLPRQARYASHVGRPKWYPRKDDESVRDKAQEAPEEDGFELSQREKQWKDQMEAMRRRIEQDPYEAVFGKRFEPFWSPLVPSWMRHEMGLKDDSSRPNESSRVKAKQESAFHPKQYSQVKTERAPYRPLEPDTTRKQTDADASTPEGQLTDYSYKKNSLEQDSDSPNGQVTSYSYGASSSWDSWTKKARRVEWDSVSGEKRRYEYDPISNRMVQVFPVESEVKQVDSVLKDRSRSSDSPLMSHGWKTGLGDKPSPPAAAVDAPVKTSKEVRAAIPVPVQSNDGKKTSVYFPSLINTSIVSSAKKPSAVSKVERNTNALTAADVRASVGKSKAISDANRAQGSLDDGRAYRFGKADPQKSQWDQAEHRVILNQELYHVTKKRQQLLKQESGSFHIEKIKREMAKLDDRAVEIHEKLDKLDTISITTAPARSSNTGATKQHDAIDAGMITMSGQKIRPRSPEMIETRKEVSSPLQSSIERMQSKELPVAEEPDDSAAHESTGDFGEYKASNVPKDWEKQAELLQTDRIRRTRGPEDSVTRVENDMLRRSGTKMAEVLREKRSVEDRVRGDYMGKRDMSPRWIDIMNARKAAHDYMKAEEKIAIDTRDAEKKARLAKANALLQAEIQDQKSRMNAHEHHHAEKLQVQRRLKDQVNGESQRHQSKIKDLRKELDNTFKQSSIHSEMQVERIRDLQRELEAARKDRLNLVAAEKEKYVQKIKDLRKELDNTFKQSSINAEMQVDRIRDLEKELAKSRSPSKTVETVQAEGDLSPNAMSLAKDSSKWYKQQASVNARGLNEFAKQLEADTKRKDRDLVAEIKGIYEKAYGTIDTNHRQQAAKTKSTSSNKPQVVEVESDVDLGKALAEYEQEETYKYKRDDLAAQIAQEEKEAHEAQAILAPENAFKMKQVIGNELTMDRDVHDARFLDANLPQLIPAEVAARRDHIDEAGSVKSTHVSGIQWEDPPLYKVLAYDSGNDMLSTATTSSNFTGKETPIAIQDALSQLYQPARFVPHFAELQKQGFQVIHGTKDLLVFKKVKQPGDAEPEGSSALQDHGLVSPPAETTSKTPSRNPIDGTSYHDHFEPATGSFASPTGFVGDRWDNLSSTEGIAQSPSTVAQPDPTLKSALNDYESSKNIDYDFKHYPRVRRQERVFSGQKYRQKERSPRRHHHEPSASDVKEMKQKWKSWRRRFRWALGVGLGGSVLAYGLGAAAERRHERELERWEKVLRESQTRNAPRWWNINEGRWGR